MSEKQEKDSNIILKEIFHVSPKDPSEIFPIIQNSDKILELKSYLESNIRKRLIFQTLSEPERAWGDCVKEIL